MFGFVCALSFNLLQIVGNSRYCLQLVEALLELSTILCSPSSHRLIRMVVNLESLVVREFGSVTAGSFSFLLLFLLRGFV